MLNRWFETEVTEEEHLERSMKYSLKPRVDSRV